ncbi:1-deoxy-D-xylulose-5-phosphate reductoisomerase [Paludicola sp. MB14-C6]|uniref:1-deoxy-D-xylulose-5-phosphate reductoisomerase n=1 Tax=Paludihabitans sp. MB14-C6 TaxID=3070656 RepID=UPI0027DD2818|nr:1-deoxy-D-xylulose-5-phosphate reductoisomerase [Paludicola sp. MB14-C6]WMJ23641.1 1-deoxy-D-xylulose-5-phosphate reductoisomerase [Paludicola sp. MB14-C6]
MKTISILGSTGSIGTQAIEVCKELGIKIDGLAAYHNTDLLAKQANEFAPKMVCIYDETKYEELKLKINNINIEIVTGMDGLCKVACLESIDLVLNSVVGMIGLQPTLAAINARKDIALANKETLVTGGKLVMEQADKMGVSIYPVDSEHSAIFQSLQGNKKSQVKKIILTASGGPFFGKTIDELKNVKVQDALKHPNWAMGAKITIDSATLMNKGLELIEACWLFNKTPSEVEIVVHRESVIHSLVEYQDNAVIAQLGVPDMKLPIQYAMTYPQRLPCNTGSLSLIEYGKLTFAKPDMDTFICLKACMEAMDKGGLYPTLVNGANEQAVALFLENKIRFLDIGKLVYSSLQEITIQDEYSLQGILKTDQLAREYVLKKAMEIVQ